jgi:hypothetical protein
MFPDVLDKSVLDTEARVIVAQTVARHDHWKWRIPAVNGLWSTLLMFPDVLDKSVDHRPFTAGILHFQWSCRATVWATIGKHWPFSKLLNWHATYYLRQELGHLQQSNIYICSERNPRIDQTMTMYGSVHRYNRQYAIGIVRHSRTTGGTLTFFQTIKLTCNVLSEAGTWSSPTK